MKRKQGMYANDERAMMLEGTKREEKVLARFPKPKLR